MPTNEHGAADEVSIHADRLPKYLVKALQSSSGCSFEIAGGVWCRGAAEDGNPAVASTTHTHNTASISSHVEASNLRRKKDREKDHILPLDHVLPLQRNNSNQQLNQQQSQLSVIILEKLYSSSYSASSSSSSLNNYKDKSSSAKLNKERVQVSQRAASFLSGLSGYSTGQTAGMPTALVLSSDVSIMDLRDVGSYLMKLSHMKYVPKKEDDVELFLHQNHIDVKLRKIYRSVVIESIKHVLTVVSSLENDGVSSGGVQGNSSTNSIYVPDIDRATACILLYSSTDDSFDVLSLPVGELHRKLCAMAASSLLVSSLMGTLTNSNSRYT